MASSRLSTSYLVHIEMKPALLLPLLLLAMTCARAAIQPADADGIPPLINDGPVRIAAERTDANGDAARPGFRIRTGNTTLAYELDHAEDEAPASPPLPRTSPDATEVAQRLLAHLAAPRIEIASLPLRGLEAPVLALLLGALRRRRRQGAS
ncbi:hypothetical protein [Noviherbaspirillum galbum]|uniref:Uncharacterized protein n=1 Tax=Noviherbaspirillum galbum TaxID=2709383 RepID=A0A6B3SYX6_9BURK|nr:hypothetical protein [Noviherbaspirillum galbum]NEX64122.1 hypothetical protein [Noviherbaspirillum galbum]